MKICPVLPYTAAKAWEAEAQRRGVSQVARSPRGFMRALQRAGSWAALPEAWKRKRNAFVARHLAQAQQNREPLWKDGKPTRRGLALFMWACRPPKRNPEPFTVSNMEAGGAWHRTTLARLRQGYRTHYGPQHAAFKHQTFKTAHGHVEIHTHPKMVLWSYHEGGKHLGGGHLGRRGSTLVETSAALDTKRKGKRVYEKILQYLRKKYDLQSDYQVSPAVAHIWKKHGVPHDTEPRFKIGRNPRVMLKPAPSLKVDLRELRLGIKIEMEHTRSRAAARIIALQHLAEHPRYYSKILLPAERRATKRNPGTPYLARLIKIFGTTNDPSAGFFLLPDGQFLDGSEGYGHGRQLDHRQINQVYPHRKNRDYGNECRTTIMKGIMRKTGLIRWMPEHWWAQVVAPPTDAQVRTLKDLAQYRRLEIETQSGDKLTYDADWADNIGRDLGG